MRACLSYIHIHIDNKDMIPRLTFNESHVLRVGKKVGDDGLLVGAIDGAGVGIAGREVGNSVGLCDGLTVGISDGYLVGKFVGYLVGIDDGKIVGFLDGINGNIVGFLDGINEAFNDEICFDNKIFDG